jgi:hypothetical protein
MISTTALAMAESMAPAARAQQNPNGVNIWSGDVGQVSTMTSSVWRNSN